LVCELASDTGFTSAPREISSSIHLIVPENAVTCIGVSSCIKINNYVLQSSQTKCKHFTGTKLYLIIVQNQVAMYSLCLFFWNADNILQHNSKYSMKTTRKNTCYFVFHYSSFQMKIMSVGKHDTLILRLYLQLFAGNSCLI
jgi:hypothetical protein